MRRAATGGLFTDWEQVPDWANIGYPIVILDADGGFDLTKPPATGGLVNRATVAEQLLYEIGDPAAYELPDVICDLREVVIDDTGPDRVRVTGARGRAPSPRYKITATGQDGYQIAIMMAIRGQRAHAKLAARPKSCCAARAGCCVTTACATTRKPRWSCLARSRCTAGMRAKAPAARWCCASPPVTPSARGSNSCKRNRLRQGRRWGRARAAISAGDPISRP